MTDKKGQRILVVEDDLSILTGLSMNLRFEGYEVIQAQDGRTGLQKVIDEAPDLLVLDVMLPEMNGFEVLEELKRKGLIVLEYVDRNGIKKGYPHNPNGSVDNIAGICDRTGLIFGLMPHPERHVDRYQHPQWTRPGSKKTRERPAGWVRAG
jgi:hypothetical protein